MRGREKSRKGRKTITPPGYSVLVAPCKLAALTSLDKGRKDRVRLAGRQAGRMLRLYKCG